MNTLQEMLDSEAYQVFQAETLLNPQYHIINDTWVDVDQMLAANENGDFGVSHGDFIDCWIDFMETQGLGDDVYTSIIKEIMSVQQWHTENASIDTVI